MKTNFNLLPQTIRLDEVVFKNRNKKYGAYDLRTHYEDEVNKALIISLAAIGLIIMMVFYLQSQTIHEPLINPNLLSQQSNVQQVMLPEKPLAQNPNPPSGSRSSLPPVITPDPLVPKPNSNDTAQTFGVHNNNPITKHSGDSSGHVITTVVPPIKHEPFHWAEKMPAFPGGEKELMKFLSKHIVFPHAAQSEGVHGKVIVTFVVGEDGKISDIKVLKDEVGYGCADAAINAVKQMPTWTPGMQNGNAVPVWFTLPVTFTTY